MHTFTGTNAEAHAEAVAAAKLRMLLRTRYHNATTATAAWQQVLASLRQPGKAESQVISEAMKQHPELCDAYNAEQRARIAAQRARR